MTAPPPKPRPLRATGALLVVALIVTMSPALQAPPAEAQTPKFGLYLAAPFVQTSYYADAATAVVQDFNEPPDAPRLAGGTEILINTPQTWADISTTNGVTGQWKRSAGAGHGGATTLAHTPGTPQLGTTVGVASAVERSEFAAAGRIDITLSEPRSCLGFWWSAGDTGNRASVYTDGGTTLVAQLTTPSVLALIGPHTAPKTVTARDGTTQYNQEGQYFGHPVTKDAFATGAGAQGSRDGNDQPFIYLHAIASGGITFDRIVLEQHPNPNIYQFEFDNFTVATTCDLDPSLVVVSESLLDPTFLAAFLASQPVPVDHARPVVTCAPDPVAPGGTVTCDVAEGPVDHEILWSAAIDGTFASRGVMLDADGRGTFTFVAPRGASGRTITVELVEWNASTAVRVSSLVPSGVPAGESPDRTLPLLWLALALGLCVALLTLVTQRGLRSSLR